jgi:hypothetical protein
MLPSFLAYSSTVKLEAICPSEMSVDFNCLHSVISKKIELFIYIVVRASNPIQTYTYSAGYVRKSSD